MHASLAGRQLKILFTVNSLQNIGGTETWLLQMLQELNQKNIQSLVFTNYKGGISERIEQAGTVVTTSIEEALRFQADLVHLQHASSKNISLLVEKLNPNTPIFNFVHGVAPQLEAPYINSQRTVEYGAVSQLARQKIAFLTKRAPEQIHLVRNFFWQQDVPACNPKQLSRFAVVSSKLGKKQINSLSKLLAPVAEKLAFYGGKSTKIQNYQDIIDSYDLFFCSGKTAIDLMGYGKPVILLEENLLGPAITSQNINRLSQMNFAFSSPLVEAFNYMKQDATQVLKKHISSLLEDDRDTLRDYLVFHHSIQTVSCQLHGIYSMLAGAKAKRVLATNRWDIECENASHQAVPEERPTTDAEILKRLKSIEAHEA